MIRRRALVDRWYAGLANADRATFSELLSDDAKVILEDIDAIQTKEEFLGSLDEWKNAVRGATIRHRISNIGDGTITVFVCYQFPSQHDLHPGNFQLSRREDHRKCAELCRRGLRGFLEQFQEKCEAVFRSQLRKNKGRHRAGPFTLVNRLDY